ncbi:hypothetical protein FOT72_04235 [Citrobacter amalonaticus]|uniref:Uncharacterized protein n=1 Tax=Citrobacter amalonaticus TaxID=35703 RepID=A0A8I0MHZ0_CITAM|nr:hypothetical protein [Citrobacter amalonaticus]
MNLLSGLPLSCRPDKRSAIRQILVIPLTAISSSYSLFRYNYQQFESIRGGNASDENRYPAGKSWDSRCPHPGGSNTLSPAILKR